jgi:excisionase family DNA binding protein
VTRPEGNSQLATELEPLLSIDEVGELLRISESGVYRLIRKGELPSVKVGGRTRFEPAAIRDFIAARRRSAAGARQDSAGSIQIPRRRKEAA